jgi:hypothetical protein
MTRRSSRGSHKWTLCRHVRGPTLLHFCGMLLRVDRSGSEEAANAGKQN